ncbi:MAG: TlpA family protein disulfide reductase [Pyrinomonadaceae bacterium]
MNTFAKRVELITNVAIIIVAVLLGFILVKNHLLMTSTPQEANHRLAGGQTHVGQQVYLPNVDWAKNGQTVVLALSTTCRYCSESASFYQQLVQKRGNSRVVAVMPQTVGTGHEYLRKLGVSVDEVKQVSIDSIGVQGTPTLLLVNSSGVVTKEWIGKLHAEQEAEVLKQL